MTLKAPFPYFGGKSRAASLVWERFGDVTNYVEPFFGSGAILLARPHEPRIETVNDADHFLANFWRAVAADPEAVAHHCDWPVNEADLSARHQWLVDNVEFRARMAEDPEYFDARVAGWWCWGACAWIGSGWCDPGGAMTIVCVTIPHGSATTLHYGRGGSKNTHLDSHFGGGARSRARLVADRPTLRLSLCHEQTKTLCCTVAEAVVPRCAENRG